MLMVSRGRGYGLTERVAFHSAQAVLVFSVHARVVFLDVVRPVELLLTYVALKRFVFLVYVLVSGVQVPPVGGVRTVGAVKPLLSGLRFRVGRVQSHFVVGGFRFGGRRYGSGRCGGGGGGYRFICRRLQSAQVAGDLFEYRALLPRFPVSLLMRPLFGHHVVLSGQVQADALCVRARVRTLRALEHLDVSVRSQPVFGHTRQ